MKTVKGTRLLIGDDAERLQGVIESCTRIAKSEGFKRVMLPSLDFAEFYKEKLNPDLRMYEFEDRKGRKLCLRPECTNTLAAMDWAPDTKLFYIEKCWRYDKPQAGRYREFIQFGVEWLNPILSMDSVIYTLESIAFEMCYKAVRTTNWQPNRNIARGSDYYKDGLGFEIEHNSLGAQKQVVGGGAYEGGAGFAIGVDRLALIGATP